MEELSLETEFANGCSQETWPLSSLALDPFEELLWAGSVTGFVTSYFDCDSNKHTSFQAHTSEVRQMLLSESHILSLGAEDVRLGLREGLLLHRFKGSDMADLRAIESDFYAHTLVAAGGSRLFRINLSTADIYPLELPGNVVTMRATSRHFCVATEDGKILLVDSRMNAVAHTIDAFAATITDMDVAESVVAVCGATRPPRDFMWTDNAVRLFDLRTLRSHPSIQVEGPTRLQFVTHPTFVAAPYLMVASAYGLLYEFNVFDHSSLPLQYELTGNNDYSLAVSTTTDVVAVGDCAGVVQKWVRGEQHINAVSRDSIHEDEYTPPTESLLLEEKKPLSSLPMPLALFSPLLSDLAPHETRIRHDPPLEVPPELRAAMKMSEFVGYAPNLLGWRANQVRGHTAKAEATSDSPAKRRVGSSEVPKRYRRVDIKYTYRGVDDFDFDHYNHTAFNGLETHIPNAYCNAMLQVLYFAAPFRMAVESHLCSNEICLTCEMGFLFQMLDRTPGHNIQATNFLKSLRTLPQAARLGLLPNEEQLEMSKVDLSPLLQSWHTFVLNQVEHELRGSPLPAPHPAVADLSHVVQRTWTILTTLKSTCQACKTDAVRTVEAMVVNLQVPTSALEHPRDVSFSSLLRGALHSDATVKSFCNHCNASKLCAQHRRVTRLPPTLAINVPLHTEAERQFWQSKGEVDPPHTPASTGSPMMSSVACRFGTNCTRPNCRFTHPTASTTTAAAAAATAGGPGRSARGPWLPYSIFVKLGDDDLVIEECTPEKGTCPDGFVEYALAASVFHIPAAVGSGHLVSIIKPGKEYLAARPDATPGWYLFNDFAVSPVEPAEAVTYNMEWKVPSIFYYTRVDIADLLPTQSVVPFHLFQELLLRDRSISRQGAYPTFRPLAPAELPQKGNIVAIDAEFVSLAREEAEIRSDGVRSVTIKPSQMACARVTLVRGQGPRAGEPFVDDYIHTTETVVDYLTQYSGIHARDLDPTVSTRHLTTLKSTYAKLRYLQERGVIFLGHGLSKDFRVINLDVARDQVIDTVELYYLPGQRKISLKFLAWFVLQLDMQSKFGHDSIEDARTALLLYNQYLKLSRDSAEWHTYLLKLYDEGRARNWTVPPKPGAAAAAAPSGR
eukprot:m.126737 g.126737  ORF g.126737 m.126737 type:complete len:1126 (+) comp14695_c0_seq1:1642-5019(+)